MLPLPRNQDHRFNNLNIRYGENYLFTDHYCKSLAKVLHLLINASSKKPSAEKKK